MEHENPQGSYARIQSLIGDDTGPPGVGAKKPHIIIRKLISSARRSSGQERAAMREIPALLRREAKVAAT